MRVNHALTALFVAVSLCSLAVASEIRVEMDQQIDNGLSNPQSEGPAIYTFSTPATVTFDTEEGDGFTRLTMGGNNYQYLYLDTVLAGLGPIDLSAVGSAIEFDCRYFQGGDNSSPYGDAPLFFRAYTYDLNTGSTQIGNKDWGIVYAVVRGNPDDPTFNDPPYPDWTHVVISGLDGPSSVGDFQENNITRIRWYATDWAGTGQDFMDIKNVVFRSGPGVFTMEDLTLALKIAAGLETSYDFDVTKFDINRDGKIDLLDIAIMSRASAEG